jgi:hypothetical protein
MQFGPAGQARSESAVMKTLVQPLRSVTGVLGATNEEGQHRGNGTGLRGDQATGRLARLSAHSTRRESHASRPPARLSSQMENKRWFGLTPTAAGDLAARSP